MTILCYHAVDPAWKSTLSVTPGAFSDHSAWLARHRRVVPLTQAAARVTDSGRLPRGIVALTFDDGFASLYTHVFDNVVKMGLPVTIFLVAETLTRQGRPVDWVDGVAPGVLTTLTAQQVLEMRDAGVEFGSHSYSHRDLTKLTQAECERDLKESRDILEDLLRQPVRSLAYPRGIFDERVLGAARKAGFTYGFGTSRIGLPSGKPLGIPRIGIYAGDGAAGLAVKSSAWYPSLRLSRLWPPTVHKAVKGRMPLTKK
jgi:peptidoglycan/xylan/chitin deacetylase (PgdA/CDA1 family)